MLAVISSVILSESCDSLIDIPEDCSFYECFDRNVNCGPDGYPLGYGLRYCSKFLKHLASFPDEGKKWITNTLICLKTALKQTYDENNESCDSIKSIAFNSHPVCYVQSGFCELFNKGDTFLTIKAMLEVYEIKDFLNLTSIKQVLDTAKLCGDQVRKNLLEIIKKILTG